MRNLSFISITMGILMFSTSAFSLSSYLVTWNGIYPGSNSGNNASCQLCHGDTNATVNPYGQALCSSNAGSINNRILAVEGFDSDMDPTASTNLTEINADTQPGWTPGAVNALYSRGNCLATGAVIAPPGSITGSLDPALGNQAPIANANGPYSGTVNVPMTFDGTASNDPDGTIVAYDWDFGDGNVGNNASPTHTYVTDGIFTVTLTVTDDFGDTGTDTSTATIGLGNQTPVAAPNGPYTGLVGSAVSFDGSASSDADGTIISYSWDFGDGNTGIGVNPSHTYATANVYNVTLTVMDDAGATDSAGTTATITDAPVNQPPVADPNGPYSATVGISLTFDGTASNDPDGTIVSYSWDFGDGNTGTGVTPTHTYMMEGNYTVALTVTDNSGATHSASTTATIGAAGNQPPVADPNGPYNGTIGVAVVFDGSASSDADGTIVSYSWDFGDGSTASGATPSHVYAADGTYTVTLVVTDDAGDTGSASTTATIGVGNQPPVADANGPYSGKVGVEVMFDGSASVDPDGTIVSYTWDFGDGTTGTGATPTHVYSDAGMYNVSLAVMDDMGATDSISTTADIAPVKDDDDDDEDDDDEDDDEDDDDDDEDDDDDDDDEEEKD